MAFIIGENILDSETWDDGEVTPWIENLRFLASCGARTIVLFKTFFDESGSHVGSPVLCLAGYVLSVDQATRLEQEWKSLLDEFGLEYFRMSECAHLTGEFKRLGINRQQAIEIEIRAIGIIKRRVEHGFAVTVDESKYNTVMREHDPDELIGDAYGHCFSLCFYAVSHWMDTRNVDGLIAYYFESGHASQSQSGQMMGRMFENQKMREKHRYLSYGFADKVHVRGLQAADLLAWQWATDYKRRLRSQRRRLDLNSLLERTHTVMHLSEHRTKEVENK